MVKARPWSGAVDVALVVIAVVGLALVLWTSRSGDPDGVPLPRQDQPVVTEALVWQSGRPSVATTTAPSAPASTTSVAPTTTTAPTTTVVTTVPVVEPVPTTVPPAATTTTAAPQPGPASLEVWTDAADCSRWQAGMRVVSTGPDIDAVAVAYWVDNQPAASVELDWLDDNDFIGWVDSLPYRSAVSFRGTVTAADGTRFTTRVVTRTLPGC